VRAENGIPPLVNLLGALDIKVQRAAAGALRTLAFKNEGNKEQVCERFARVSWSERENSSYFIAFLATLRIAETLSLLALARHNVCLFLLTPCNYYFPIARAKLHMRLGTLYVLSTLGLVRTASTHSKPGQRHRLCLCLRAQIVECKALPVLIQMLCSEDQGVHYEAVGVLGNLVHSSQHIKRKV
jgi:hypothetical protein